MIVCEFTDERLCAGPAVWRAGRMHAVWRLAVLPAERDDADAAACASSADRVWLYRDGGAWLATAWRGDEPSTGRGSTPGAAIRATEA